jgi:hypothetical protein
VNRRENERKHPQQISPFNQMMACRAALPAIATTASASHDCATCLAAFASMPSGAMHAQSGMRLMRAHF